MNKAIFLAMALLLLASSIAWATCESPPTGDRAFRFGWGMTTASWTGYTPPAGKYNLVAVNGPDTTWGVPGQSLAYRLGPYNATAWIPMLCTAQDTFCFDVSSASGWTIVCSPVTGTPEILPAGGYFWTQYVTIQIPCSATIGSYQRVIASCLYTNTDIVCDPTCADCANPNTRPANNTKFYSSDTLYVRVLPAPPPPAPTILQDTLTLVEQGQTQAYIPFSLCNGDQCFAYDIGYTIKSKGQVGPAINVSGTVNVAGGKCVDVFGIINAGSSTPCQYDTLTMIAWIPIPRRLVFGEGGVGDDFLELRPELNQTFFIGDGLAGSVRQRFYAPASATRLYLGFVDAIAFQGLPGGYEDNGGSLNADFVVGSSPYNLTIDAQANIFGAGQTVPPAPGGGGGGVLPPDVTLPQGANSFVEFTSVTGLVSPCASWCGYAGPEGRSGGCDVLSWGGISGIVHQSRSFFLAGVFLSESSPFALSDTCVQVIHVVEPSSVPLFTVPVVTILVLALILAVAIFMRRRAVNRA